MQLGPEALRFVMAQGFPAVIDVLSGSMAPTIAVGTKVNVVGMSLEEEVAVGDVVLFGTTGVPLLHRVMAVFEEAGRRFVVHQGDARASTFAIAARVDVLARMTTFAADARPAPTVDRLDAAALVVFRRRRLACEAFVRARLLARALGVRDLGLVRRCARAYRALARAVLD
ncbi:MAG TPA: S26 family signal peptidase [Polyangia bacterium]|jgi:hypothetical protein|nr:S26 family signal peptidase [Polyangia bacterium]